MKLEQVILRDTRANQPAADATNIGALYFVTDEEVLERSNGSAWQSYGPAGGGAGVPSGTIVIWSGSLISIPSGWALCDGENGTPNLQDKFVIGAGLTYDVTQEGGDFTHVHHIGGSTDGDGASVSVTNATEDILVSAPDHIHTINFDSESGSSLPPFAAFAYIMKL